MRLLRKTFWVLRREGPGKVLQIARRKLFPRLEVHTSYPFRSLAYITEIDPYDSGSLPQPSQQWTPHAKLRLRWFMPEPGYGSGGHLNLFRIIDQLTQRGHQSEVAILWGAQTGRSRDEMADFIRRDFGAEVSVVWDSDPPSAADVVLATTWQSSYVAVRDTACAARAYVVQDWEPDFYPRGSEALFAENSYQLGFHHITAGPWLAHRLETLGATASWFPFAADPEIYYPDPEPRVNGQAHIVFYARPFTPRRCFELGIEALRLLSKRLGPGRLLVTLAGAPIPAWPADFAIRRVGILSADPLRRLYSSADAILVLSSTNTSLLPLEAGLCGVPVVDLHLPSVTGTLTDGVSARLARPSPKAIAETLADLIDHPDEARALGARARAHALTCSWELAGIAVEAGLFAALTKFGAAPDGRADKGKPAVSLYPEGESRSSRTQP